MSIEHHHRPRSSSRATPPIGARRDYHPPETVRGENGSDESDSVRLAKMKQLKRRSLTRADYSRESLKRLSRSSDQYGAGDLMWEMGALEEQSVTSAKKEKRSKEKERERDREKDKDRESIRAEKRKKRSKEEKARSKEEKRREASVSRSVSLSTTEDSTNSFSIFEAAPSPEDYYRQEDPSPTDTSKRPSPRASPPLRPADTPERVEHKSVTLQLPLEFDELNAGKAQEFLVLDDEDDGSKPQEVNTRSISQELSDTASRLQTHKPNHSIDSTGSIDTVRGSGSNENSPRDTTKPVVSTSFMESNAVVPRSSSPHCSRREPVYMDATTTGSSWYPPPPPPQHTARTRTRRPHSFSTKAVIGYGHPPAIEEDPTTPRQKPPHNRRASNPYPPPYSGYEYQQPAPYPSGYEQQIYNAPYPAHPRMEYDSAYGRPAPYSAPADERNDPMQYADQNGSPPRPPRKSRRRSSGATSNGQSRGYYEGAMVKIRGEDSPLVSEGEALEADHVSAAQSWHTRSRSVSASRSSMKEDLSIKEEEEPVEDWEEHHQKEAPALPPSPPPSETGYPFLAQTVAQNPNLQIYRRFTTLNHRILLHMQDEITELSAMLDTVDEVPESGIRNRRNMVSTPGGEQRLQLLSTIAFKLEQYNKAVKSYQDTLALDSAPPEAVASYASWLAQNKPVADSEAAFLAAEPHDLMLISRTPTPAVTPSVSPTPEPEPASRWASWLPVARPQITGSTLQALTIIAILLAPYLAEQQPCSCSHEPPPWNWPAFLMRASMWVLALAPPVVSLMDGKGLWAFFAVTIGLGSGLVLLAFS